MAGLALAATMLLPRIPFAASASKSTPNPRRRLGALEVSAMGLGRMSMNSGTYNPPWAKGAMIEIHGARLREGLLELSDVEAPLKG